MKKTIAAGELQPLLAQRQQHLAEIAAQLKTELFGIDEVIDRVIDSVRAWYVLPQCITRPVIVCLWGLTGTGKTQLTRRLAQLLGFYDRFVEVQMDGFSNGAGSYRGSSIASMLEDSGIDEGAPGILVLDEFQRYRTKDNKGEDAKAERYQDVWMLLSDGRLPPPLGALVDIERKLAGQQYDAERDDEEKPDKAYRFRLDAWDAQELKRSFKLHEPLTEIMQWPSERVHQLFVQFREAQQHWETDYSRLLVFVCGNLDEMYRETAQRVEDCDTDADIFHRLTQRLSVIDVKKALSERFKPEQIARLGNNHVIYPSLSRATYERLIHELCAGYVHDIKAQTDVQLELGADVLDALYANSVFPAQGTRPLFSAVHAILSSTLVKTTLWALEQGLDLQRPVHISLAADRRHLLASGLLQDSDIQTSERFAVTLDLDRLKQRANADFRALLAVHEAGHGLVYALLFGQAPQEIKINIASFEGGYNSFASLKATTRQNALDMMCVSLAGRVAEDLVFGKMACTAGSESDYKQATALAARHIRYHGFGTRISRTDVTSETEDHLNTDVAPSNQAIEELLQAQYQRTRALLEQQHPAFGATVDALMARGSITPQEMGTLMAGFGMALRMPSEQPDDSLVLEPFAERLAAFRAGQA
ncbi:AAA family ATPase [Comamonas sp. GB3 AK4-5]|uniref:AAA family ATPase n=1 Tax=Comamonas sp. GB3 AK4-5 TaxID=3231487 RepID=UPI00351EFD90